MYIINTYNKIGRAGLDMYDKEKYVITDVLDQPDAIMVHSAPLHDVDMGKNLKAIVRVGAGVNTIPVERLTEEGVAVFNTPGGNANAVKELTVAAIVMISRNVEAAAAWVKGLNTTEPGKEVEKGKEAFRGPEIMGKKIGIIGVGAIGSRMAKACSDLGMDVIGYDPYLLPARKKELRAYLNFTNDVEEIYKTCDYITIHVPLTAETKDYIGTAEFEMMKPGVYLINYARGPVINNEAVVEALKNGKVKAYATDFPTAEQLELSNVFATPHLGAGTPEADENCAKMAAKQIMDYLENGNIVNSVNLPAVSFPRAAGGRITIIHHNKPGMLGVITEKVANAGMNIENLVNKSRDTVAYTILDFDEDVPSALAETLEQLDGVMRVRVL
ncbi:MAG: phosphoglycerate dehydrogenase [Oscillospiraceae bacterium]|nr:3-phosphoglycerate dehydrogenase [Oscillospiraceae bacterium]MBQ2795735.1 phosphoglycerate dehydrogenase [Oscillospiraceae bacterium]MBQ3236090.1 phosphoglycerate dehydrogenase [Oscillospiraceae bacterium]MBQ4117436.1 phosphoglycerate dehydrogenase [Oscillospiraceae bacterium]MBQ6701104.1 phosphoglycerate dehydrogenase [Oscillospiraceae bacterium]